MAVTTLNPTCIFCGTQLTQEEAQLLNSKVCWFCIADAMDAASTSDQTPDPRLYGRPDGVEQKQKRQATGKPSNFPAKEAVPDVTKEISFTPEEKKEFITKFGFDPDRRAPVTVLTQPGGNEDTYLTFSVRGHIPKPYQAQYLRLMKEVLDRFTDILTFGSNNAMTFERTKTLPAEYLFR